MDGNFGSSISLSFGVVRLVFSLLVGMKLFQIIVLFYVYLLTNDVEHLFMCLMAILSSSLVKCLLNIFGY